MQNRATKRHTKSFPTSGLNRNWEPHPTEDSRQLLPVWPKDLADRSIAGRKKLMMVIERELRKERRRGVAGDPGYDIARHARLVQLLKDERQALFHFGR